MKPVVSVVIPTYNRASDLRRALTSVLGQTFTGWEALVVDNHSTDGTDAVVSSFKDSRIKLLKINNDGVIGASRNRGIRHAQGQYIAFLDSDDWWTHRKLQASVAHLEQGADIVYHDMFVVTRPAQALYWRKDRSREVVSPVFRDLLANGNALKNSSVVARRRLFEVIGGLSEDPALVAVEDFDAWLRISAITEKFKRIPQTLGYYWAGGGNMSNPNRTLKVLDAFEERYAEQLRGLGFGVWWLRYSRIRADYMLKNYAKALELVLNTDWRKAPVFVRAKVFATTLMLRVHE